MRGCIAGSPSLWARNRHRGCSAGVSCPPVSGGLRWEEEKMTRTVARLVVDNQGQDLAEYGIALAVIATLAAAAAVVIALDVGTLWSRAQNLIDSAAS